MKRDVGYAVFAALTLSALAALWALAKAPELADPDTQDRVRGPSGSVPVLPRPAPNTEAIEQAQAVLNTRDLFRAAAPADMATLRRLSTAQIAPPVELVPVEPAPRRDTARFTATPQVYAPPRPAQPAQNQNRNSVAALPFSPPPQPQPQTARPVPRPQPIAPSPSARQAVTMRDPRFPLTLRGVFPDPRTGGRAHVALPNGRIVSTGPGGVIEGFQVVQINPASIIVQGRGGPPYRLEMPGY